jgi:hypothetical protein
LVTTAVPLAVAGAGISLLFTASHPVEDLVHLLLIVAGALVFVLAQIQAQYLTSKRAGPRPRWHYLLFCLGYLVAAFASAAIGGWATHITSAGSVRQ